MTTSEQEEPRELNLRESIQVIVRMMERDAALCSGPTGDCEEILRAYARRLRKALEKG